MVKIYDKSNRENELTCREFVKKYGKQFSEFFSWSNRVNPENDYEIETDGNAKDIWELMVLMMLNWENDTGFIHSYEMTPEDLVEDRTDYDEMKSYAIGLARFIERALELLANMED